MSLLDLDSIEKQTLLFLTPANLEPLKSKKYALIASVAITHAVATCYPGHVLRMVLAEIPGKEAVIKTLLKLQ
jgi:hypothetical protein